MDVPTYHQAKWDFQQKFRATHNFDGYIDIIFIYLTILLLCLGWKKSVCVLKFAYKQNGNTTIRQVLRLTWKVSIARRSGTWLHHDYLKLNAGPIFHFPPGKLWQQKSLRIIHRGCIAKALKHDGLLDWCPPLEEIEWRSEIHVYSFALLGQFLAIGIIFQIIFAWDCFFV